MTQASVNTPINTGSLNILSLARSFQFPTGSKHSGNDELRLFKDDFVCSSKVKKPTSSCNDHVIQPHDAKSALRHPTLHAFCDCEQ